MYLNYITVVISFILVFKELQCVKVILIAMPKNSHKRDTPYRSLKNLTHLIDSLVNKPYHHEDYYDKDRQAMRTSQSDSESVDLDDKIVGGFDADINWYPYHVAYGTNCGGTIISKLWVITAGHCGKKTFIRAGSKYVGKGKYYPVQSNHPHPGWAANSQKEHPFDYDFQLLRLVNPLHFGPSVQAVKIARIEDMEVGTVITVTGWGNTVENGPYSSVLRAVRVPIIPKETCQKVPFPYFQGTLTNRMFCAGFVTGQKDACQGDSGGPAVAEDRLFGMVSFGYGCATPGSYGVYSKVATVRPWIEQVTGLKLD